jgi:hypothetical protein
LKRSNHSRHGHLDDWNALWPSYFPLIFASFRAENRHIKAFVLKKLQLTLQETNCDCRIHSDNQAGPRQIPIDLFGHPESIGRTSNLPCVH